MNEGIQDLLQTLTLLAVPLLALAHWLRVFPSMRLVALGGAVALGSTTLIWIRHPGLYSLSCPIFRVRFTPIKLRRFVRASKAYSESCFMSG